MSEDTSSDTLRDRFENSHEPDQHLMTTYQEIIQDAIEYAARLEAEVEDWKQEAEVMTDAAEACRRMEAERDRLHKKLVEIVVLFEAHMDEPEGLLVDLGHYIEEGSPHPDDPGTVRDVLREVERGDTVEQIRREGVRMAWDYLDYDYEDEWVEDCLRALAEDDDQEDAEDA